MKQLLTIMLIAFASCTTVHKVSIHWGDNLTLRDDYDYNDSLAFSKALKDDVIQFSSHPIMRWIYYFDTLDCKMKLKPF